MELYDEDGEKVEAFTQKEVDAKIKEASTSSSADTKTAKDELATKTKELEDLSKKYDDKKNSYSELQKKTKEDEGKYKEVLERDSNAYKKTMEEKIKAVAGEDKEYAAELQKQLDSGVGSETADAKDIDKQIEKAQALTKIELSREVNSPMGGSGGAPDSPVGNNTNFTETADGKAMFDAMSNMAGLPAEETK